MGSSIAIIGSGPAGLMAADVLSRARHRVVIFEKRKSAGRKLLIAGSSGLNITHGAAFEDFIAHYSGSREFWRRVIGEFPPEKWIAFVESLGIRTFRGTSNRFFVEDMKAPTFLKAWLARLTAQGVEFRFGQECVSYDILPRGCSLGFTTSEGARDSQAFDAACFALGGGSWEPHENPLRWPALFRGHGVEFAEFAPANVGYRVAWPDAFLEEAEGLPLKKIILTSSKARREGDAMITRYGIEGTPVYFGGETGTIHLDLRPDLALDRIREKLRAVKENLSPIRRVKKTLALCPAAFALVYHLTPKNLLQESDALAERIKNFPLELLGPQPLAEAISSSGGIKLSELDPSFMIRRSPSIFAAGEMLDWEAPTGGFLIQGCVAQGWIAGQGLLDFLQARQR